MGVLVFKGADQYYFFKTLGSYFFVSPVFKLSYLKFNEPDLTQRAKESTF